MVRCVHTATGITIDIPGAAEPVVLLDDGIGNAEPAKRDTERERADTGADDQDVV